MDDSVRVLEDETEVYADGTAARIRVLKVPKSGKFEEGIKYTFHYGRTGGDDPIIRLDNHHGDHELHLGDETYHIDFPGVAMLYRVWWAALSEDKREDW